MANLKGRGSQAVRPGITIKGVLMGEIPLPNGEHVTEATITDIHNTYKELIHRENMRRPKNKKLHGMTYPSFYALFRLARYLGLVEVVRDELMLSPPAGGDLYSLRRDDGMDVVVSTRRVYRLTDKGREAEQSWRNLSKAYKHYRSMTTS